MKNLAFAPVLSPLTVCSMSAPTSGFEGLLGQPGHSTWSATVASSSAGYARDPSRGLTSIIGCCIMHIWNRSVLGMISHMSWRFLESAGEGFRNMKVFMLTVGNPTTFETCYGLSSFRSPCSS
jgi:hypothetical protein